MATEINGLSFETAKSQAELDAHLQEKAQKDKLHTQIANEVIMATQSQSLAVQRRPYVLTDHFSGRAIESLEIAGTSGQAQKSPLNQVELLRLSNAHRLRTDVLFPIGPDVLHTAIARLHNSPAAASAIILYLIEHVDMEYCDSQGCTALQLAIWISSKCVIDMISKGANIHAVNNKTERTCIHYAAEAGNLDIVALCILKGVDPKKCDVDKNTALHLAASIKDGSEVIKLLHKNGLNVNQQNSKGETPLYFACRTGNLNNVQTLLNIGATPKTTPSSLEIAIMNKHHAIAKLLIEKAAL